MILLPPIDPDARIDFFAGSDNSFQQMKSLYNSLSEERRGVFYASPSVQEDGIKLYRITGNKVDGINPLVVCAYRDLHSIFYIAEDRPFIMLEREYTRETRGLLKTVSLFLCGDSRSYDFRRVSSDNVSLFNSDQQAISKLLEYVKGKDVETITEVNGKSVGIIYMAWGEKALQAVKKSLASLRRLGYVYPVVIVGDLYTDIRDSDSRINLEWTGESPFDTSKHHNFKFRAGRIKPHLAKLSPFDLNLYIDADTQFVKPIHKGFELLNDYDLVVTEEILSLGDLYNKKMAGWELNLLERDTTVIELGGDDTQKFINSGVMFFRRNKKVLSAFADWHKEWLRFQEWDEQLALMRALHNHSELKVKKLSHDWNDPQLNKSTVIFHNYGRGDVRINPS